jgi:hypothetical protein
LARQLRASDHLSPALSAVAQHVASVLDYRFPRDASGAEAAFVPEPAIMGGLMFG